MPDVSNTLVTVAGAAIALSLLPLSLMLLLEPWPSWLDLPATLWVSAGTQLLALVVVEEDNAEEGDEQ
jgi:hypothetical protein